MEGRRVCGTPAAREREPAPLTVEPLSRIERLPNSTQAPAEPLPALEATMTKSQKKAASTDVADSRKVAAMLLEAAKRSADLLTPADNARLLEACRKARREVSFAEMHSSVAATSGVLSLLTNAVFGDNGELASSVDWGMVADLLDDCRSRLCDAHVGLSHLRDFEVESDTPAEASR
jgi:hypothetical protein